MTMPIIFQSQSANVKSWRSEDEFYAHTETSLWRPLTRFACGAMIMAVLVSQLVVSSTAIRQQTARHALFDNAEPSPMIVDANPRFDLDR